MTFLNSNVVMVRLAVQGDSVTKPNAAQPPLADGFHLRWAFDSAKVFPGMGIICLGASISASILRPSAIR